MKVPACCVLLTSMIFMSGCCLQQTCCTCASYCDAGVVITPSLSESGPIPFLEPPPTVPVEEPPPAVEPPALPPPAEEPPVLQLPTEELQTPGDRPARRANREGLIPVQIPPV